MVRAAAERLKAWWLATGYPFVQGWWADLDEHPAYHFASMVVGMCLLALVKFMVFVLA